MKHPFVFQFLLLLLLIPGCDRPGSKFNQSDIPGDNPVKSLRYIPDGEDFLITNGDRRFNRALYGTNTAFRIEAGDLPEFALYLPGMGGNFKFGLADKDTSIWLIDAAHITARYRPGSMLYEIGDPLLKKGKLFLQVLASHQGEGMIIRVMKKNVGDDAGLVWVFGGASGQRFSRDGDIGADPESSFYLKPEYCQNNTFSIDENRFTLQFISGRPDELRTLKGAVPPGGKIGICDAGTQGTPAALTASTGSERPVLAGTCSLKGDEDLYFMVFADPANNDPVYENAPRLAESAELARKELAGRIRVHTPDPFINTYGGALAVAADAIWEEPSYLHGAVAWRMRLNGWRGAYAGDWLGWHDRARMHFEGYARAQYTEPESGPNVPDPKTNLARQEEIAGNSIYTSGYISRYPDRLYRPHHYDMNLVFIDQLLWHINWTGDMEFAREMWPVIRRHLAWEKRCFDGNDDGLYDAYCCIWASDALQYSGGGVTHSSAYNYRANRMAARIAEKLGEDPEPYEREAEKIYRAVRNELWLPDRGWYAEYKDLLGLQRVHPSAGIWTIYHSVDGGLPDPFEAWQSLQYINNHIPHIPIRIKDLPGEEYFTLSTTSWMPYEWSINNVALAENLHTALAFWQGGDCETAFRLWKSQVLESMYLGASPGNFQQLSVNDAFRGELYRDFADPVGMGARTLVEGLFGIKPDLSDGRIIIEPGLPDEWSYASLETPDIQFDYQRKGQSETYIFRHNFPGDPQMIIRLPARLESVRSIRANGQDAEWSASDRSVGRPLIEVIVRGDPEITLEIDWKGKTPETPEIPAWLCSGGQFVMTATRARIVNLKDPQKILDGVEMSAGILKGVIAVPGGDRILFVQLEQGDLSWWMPVELSIREPLELLPEPAQPENAIQLRIRNNLPAVLPGEVQTGSGENQFRLTFSLAANETSEVIIIPGEYLIPGRNRILVNTEEYKTFADIVNWQVGADPESEWRTIEMQGYFNDMVTNIFKNKYLSPRSPYPTLQLPVQGIGDWCSFNKSASIDDNGLRSRAGSEHTILLDQGIPLSTPGDPEADNILFTSLWDNYPGSAVIPLSGRATHAYLLMTGSTHHMQSRIANGQVDVVYSDGSSETLELINPDTWWPIEQDYYRDSFAFRIDGIKPPRIYLKTGEVQKEDYRVLARNKTIQIDGGAATLLDIPLDPEKELSYLRMTTLSNDVVIGLMSITLAMAK